jgi:hypothetical protein
MVRNHDRWPQDDRVRETARCGAMAKKRAAVAGGRGSRRRVRPKGAVPEPAAGKSTVHEAPNIPPSIANATVGDPAASARSAFANNASQTNEAMLTAAVRSTIGRTEPILPPRSAPSAGPENVEVVRSSAKRGGSTMTIREVTYADLRRELTVQEWWEWARSTFAELKASDEDRRYMRFNKGPMKRLKEEVIPTLRLADRQFPDRDDLLISFPANDDPGSADAMIGIRGASTRIPVQVTCDWTYEDEARLRILERDGLVHGWGEIRKVNGQFETQGQAYSIEQVVDSISGLILNRLTAKATHGGYAKDTWLLVHINDERWPPEALPDILERVGVAALASPFAATFLIGSTEEKRICALLSGTAFIPPSTSP